MNNIVSNTSHLERNLKFVLVGSIFFYLMIQFNQIFVQAELFPVNKFTLGIDFRDYYNAIVNFKNDTSIYTDDLIVTPPTFLLLLLPLGTLPFDSAVKVFFLTNLVVAAISVYLTLVVFKSKSQSTLVYSLLFFLLSFPFLFLIERGNIDLLVLLSFVIGLLLFKKNYKILSGMAFALSIALKLYPALLLIPLLLNKEKKCLGGIVGMGAFLFFLFPSLNLEFINLRLLPSINTSEISRFSHFRMDENGSFANLFYGLVNYFKSVFALDQPINEVLLFKSSTFVFLAMLVLLIKQNFQNKRNVLENIVLYTPFMIAIPKLVFLYEYVMLVPLTIMFLRQNHSKKPLLLQVAFCIPFVLIGINTIILEKLWQTDRYHFLPVVGLFVLMLCSLTWSRRKEQNIIIPL